MTTWKTVVTVASSKAYDLCDSVIDLLFLAYDTHFSRPAGLQVSERRIQLTSVGDFFFRKGSLKHHKEARACERVVMLKQWILLL